MNEKIRVLMVDDEEQFRETTKKLLNRRGFETILAGSAEQALEKLKEGANVIIMDIKMPGMDGHEALEKIKKRSPEVPVIMLTGHGAESSAKEALAQGAFDYLSKPCDMELLATKISEAYRLGFKKGSMKEQDILNAMIPLEEYTSLDEDKTVLDALVRLRESFASKMCTSKIMETGHRSILVLNKDGNLKGVLAIRDLLEAIMPAYLSAPKPSMADSIQYSPMFWKGMFSIQVKELGKKKITEIMSPPPLGIGGDSNLMEAAYLMVCKNVRRLAVFKADRLVGLIREQDLFFAMNEILK